MYEIYGVFHDGTTETVTTCCNAGYAHVLAAEYARRYRRSRENGKFFDYFTYRRVD